MDKHTIAHLKTVMSTDQLIDFLADQLAAAELELIKPLPIGELIHRLEGQTYRKWYDDDELNKWRERAEAAEARPLVPQGYCIMPESLTAENGAKHALSGEFYTETNITCEECGGDCVEDDPCESCNDLGVKTVKTAIDWSTIKDIYKMAVSVTVILPAGYPVEGGNTATIAPAPEGVVMRPSFEKPLERCAAARDGECSHKECSQLRDNEPMSTGRHCPIDNWDE